jgi:uncharacterized protein YidB (DUF937 family)
MANSIFGSDGGSAVPGGNVGKPLIIALLALLAARYFGKKDQGQSASADPQPTSRAPQADPSGASPGDLLDGLGGLLKQFQQKGLGDVVDSWVNRGKNEDISTRQVSDALGSDVVDQLARRTGLSRDEVINELARMLPSAVDRMTPDGRLPTQHEFERLID